MKLGDSIAAVTKALGIAECDSCAKRRKRLNQVDLDSGWKEITAGLIEAIKGDDEHGGAQVDVAATTEAPGRSKSEREGGGEIEGEERGPD